MEHDFMNRGYLLPPGCKDLIDVLNLKRMQPASQSSIYLSKLNQKLTPKQMVQWSEFVKKFKLQLMKLKLENPFPKPAVALPPVVGQIVVAAETSVAQLAALLGQKEFQIVADVMMLGFLVTDESLLGFEVVSKVARKHGFFAIRAAY
jgi:hypothetical protein